MGEATFFSNRMAAQQGRADIRSGCRSAFARREAGGTPENAFPGEPGHRFPARASRGCFIHRLGGPPS